MFFYLPLRHSFCRVKVLFGAKDDIWGLFSQKNRRNDIFLKKISVFFENFLQIGKIIKNKRFI